MVPMSVRLRVVAANAFNWQADTLLPVMRDIILASGLVTWRRCCRTRVD